MRVILSITLAALGLSFMQCVAGSRRYARPPSAEPQAQAYSHYLAAVVHQRSGRLDQAIKELRQASRLDPSAKGLVLEEIMLDLEEERYEEALTACQRALDQDPGNPRLLIILGRIYYQLERFDEAIDTIRTAVEKSPDNALGFRSLMQAIEPLERTNDLVSVIDIYEKLVTLTHNKNFQALLYTQLGINLTRIDDADGARSALEKALELNPGLTSARRLLTSVLMEKEENDKARENLEVLAKKTPVDPWVQESMAGLYGRAGRFADAARYLQQIVSEEKAKPYHRLELMYALLRAGDYDGAQAALPSAGAPIFGTLLKALARREADAPYTKLLETLDQVEGDVDEECRAYLAQLLYLFGKEDTGGYFVDALRQLRATGVESKNLDMILARTLLFLERNDEAAPVLQSTLDKHGDDKWAHYYLATIFEDTDDVPEVEKHLKAFLSMDPDNAEVMNFLGYVYAEKNIKLDEAERLLNRALELDPQNGFYLDSLGWINFRRGNADRAVELIRQAIRAMPTDDAVLRDHLGDAYLLQGKVKNAVAEWERARRLDPNLKGVEEKLKKHAGEARAPRKSKRH